MVVLRVVPMRQADAYNDSNKLISEFISVQPKCIVTGEAQICADKAHISSRNMGH